MTDHSSEKVLGYRLRFCRDCPEATYFSDQPFPQWTCPRDSALRSNTDQCSYGLTACLPHDSPASASVALEPVDGHGTPEPMLVASSGKRKGTVRFEVRVSAGSKEKFDWCCRELGVTTCPLFEGMTEAVYQCLKGKAQSTLISKNTYLFADVTIQRLTYKMVRAMKGSQVENVVTAQTEGSREACWFCRGKPRYVVDIWTGMDICHEFYTCEGHFEKTRKLFPRGVIRLGWKPL